MRRIKLTQGKFAIVDDDDYPWLVNLGWYALRLGKKGRCRGNFYAVRHDPIEHNKLILMHRYLCVGPFKVDHKNRNTLDNRRHNLRPATSKQNSQNQGLRVSNKSGFKGVSWYKRTARWVVHICINGKQKSAGYFHDPEKAARHYDRLAREYHGEFAVLNFPKKGEQ